MKMIKVSYIEKKVAWAMFLSGPDGAHYHFWFPKVSIEELKELKKESRKSAQDLGGPTSFSYEIKDDLWK